MLNFATIQKAKLLVGREGLSLPKAAARLGVQYSTLWDAIRGRCFQHLDAPRGADADYRIFRSISPSDKEWIFLALEAIRKLATDLETFTVDEIWIELGDDTPLDRSILGGVLRLAQAEGWCEPTEAFASSKRPSSHRRPIRVWRSLIYSSLPITSRRPK